MIASRLFLLFVLVLAGCAEPQPITRRTLPLVGLFSDAKLGDSVPSGWEPWILSNFKKPTEYRIVRDGGRTVIKAKANASASGLIYGLSVDLKKHPYLTWRWKVAALIEDADNTRKSKEDSPVRLVVAFGGNMEKLSFDDRLFAQQFKMFTRRELPYATLMYIWENRVPENTVITNAHTGRIKMIVAETGSKRLGQWYTETRNVYEDYKRAFGEEPPPVQWVAIMTDTDNTGGVADAYYGDIAFLTDTPLLVEQSSIE
ncbi:MAG TPA: DUF3047 domain-containing protein [Burkholderiales bacterium]|nr:DUF3047 domain-containing protein [Burkholderiales bacterium]